MALSTSTARSRVKNLLDIASSNTDFDSIIDEFVLNGVARLYPYVQREVAAQSVTDFDTPYAGRVEIDMSGLATVIEDARMIEGDTGTEYVELDDYLVHGTTLIINDVDSDISTIRIFGLDRHDLDTVTQEFELPVIYFAISDFYNHLVGDKRRYNIYMQSTGARGVDNMQDMAVHFEDLANAYINDRATLYGRS